MNETLVLSSTGSDRRAQLERALADHLREARRAARHWRELVDGLYHTILRALEERDEAIGAHAASVTDWATRVARELGLPSERLDAVRLAALLHDVGKVDVDDATLNKAGPLSDAEWARMREHPEVGHTLLTALPLPRETTDAVRYHHERYDGTGYPHGLLGEAIPLAARIVAVADAYDAMVAQRPYRASLSPRDACAEIARCAGSHFCPMVVAAFLRLTDHGRPTAMAA